MNDPANSDDSRKPNNPEQADPSKPVQLLDDDSAGMIAGETLDQVGAATVPVETKAQPSTGRSAFLVGAGILISRIVGLIRQRIFAHYFGSSAAGDAFGAAFRIPNFLQNVFGEGALSASFIPVYAKLIAQNDEKEATRIANAVFGLLALITSLIVLIGVLATPYFVTAIAAGFQDERRDLTIKLVRILFPGAGLLVLSAWCLGVLNSHHRFFISYTAPVAWNVAIIAALFLFGNSVDLPRLAEVTAWGSVIGSALQFGVQLPTVVRLVHRFLPLLDLTNPHVKQVMRNFFPVFMSRGVVQISAFVDAALASFLGQGAVIALMYAQSLYTLPVSLFGMSVSAAELPTMARTLGADQEVADKLRRRLDDGLHRIAFFIVPSSMAFLALGDIIAAVLYQTGRFTHSDSNYVWAILAGSSVGLLASTLGRLYSSTYYALNDTRTPLRFAVVRVVLTTVLGYLCSLPLPRAIGIEPKWGVAGLTASAGIAGWVEFVLLRQSLNKRIGKTGLAPIFVIKLWTGAAIGSGIGWGLRLLLGSRHPLVMAIVVLGGYGVTYFAVTAWFGIGEAKRLTGRAFRILRISR